MSHAPVYPTLVFLGVQARGKVVAVVGNASWPAHGELAEARHVGMASAGSLLAV